MPTKEKEKQVAVLKDRFKQSKSVIIADHTGINVADLTTLRRDLRKAKAEFKVAKNTLLKIAVKETGYEQAVAGFTGPTSMIFGFDDPSIPAKIIYEFSKKTDIPKVKAFLLGDQIYSVSDFKRIAQLPPRDQMLSIVLGAVNGPILNFIMTIDGVTRNFIGLVDALAEARK